MCCHRRCLWRMSTALQVASFDSFKHGGEKSNGRIQWTSGSVGPMRNHSPPIWNERDSQLKEYESGIRHVCMADLLCASPKAPAKA